VYEKLCRIDGVCGNVGKDVFRHGDWEGARATRALPLRRDRQLLLYTSSATIAMGHLLGASQVCERVLESARWLRTWRLRPVSNNGTDMECSAYLCCSCTEAVPVFTGEGPPRLVAPGLTPSSPRPRASRMRLRRAGCQRRVSPQGNDRTVCADPRTHTA